jgi:alcohol dehydrogenase class IV
MLTIDPFLQESGVGERIVSLLEKAGVKAVTWTDIQPNPSCFGIDKASALAREEKCDCVVAVGGGSAMDFGKGVAVVAANPGTSWEYTERSDHQVKRPAATLPIVVVPTTAGTGSEATRFAVLNNPEIKEKSTIVSESIFPDLVVIDPDLMVTMPPGLTASTGFDALAHAIESRISVFATPFSCMAAMETIRLVARYLPAAVANGENREAREAMAWAAALGGVAIGQIGVALPHALAQPVGGLKDAPHGESIATVMVHILEKSYLADLESFAAVSEALDPSVAELPLRERAELCSSLVEQLLDDIHIDVRLGKYAVTEDDIEKLTHIALTGYAFDITCHPLKVTEEDIRQIYRECL